MRHRRRNKNKAAGVASGRVVTSTDRTNETGSSESLTDVSYGETKMEARKTDMVFDVECGPNKAKFYLDKVQMGSKGQCVLFEDSWLTPNEFQFVSGRETAKDWKRSIRHHDKSLKLLMSRGLLSLSPAECRCEHCVGNSSQKFSDEHSEGTDTIEQKVPSTVAGASSSPQPDLHSPIDGDINVSPETEAHPFPQTNLASPVDTATNVSQTAEVSPFAESDLASPLNDDTSVSWSVEASASGLPEPNLPINNDTSISAKEDEVLLCASKKKLKTRKRTLNASKKHRRKRAKNHQCSRESAGINTNILKIKRVDDSNEYVACVIAPGVQEETTDRCVGARSASNPSDNIKTGTSHSEKLNNKEDIDVDIGHMTEETDVYDLDRFDKQIRGETDNNTGFNVSEKPDNDCGKNEMKTQVRDNTEEKAKRSEELSTQDSNKYTKARENLGNLDCNARVDFPTDSAGNIQHDMTAVSLPIKIVDDLSGIDNTSYQKEDTKPETLTTGVSKLILAKEDAADKDGFGLEEKGNPMVRLKPDNSMQIDVLEERCIYAVNKSPPSLYVNETSSIGTGDGLNPSLPAAHDCEHINLNGDQDDSITSGSTKAPNHSLVLISGDNRKDSYDKDGNEVSLNNRAVNSCKPDLSTKVSNTVLANDKVPVAPDTCEMERRHVVSAAGVEAEKGTKLDESKEYNTDKDEYMPTPTKKARLTSIINQLRSYKKQLNIDLDVQKKSDNSNIGLSLLTECNKTKEKHKHGPNKVLAESQPTSKYTPNTVKLSSQALGVQAVTTSSMTAHDIADKTKRTKPEMKEFTGGNSLPQLTKWPMFLSESMRASCAQNTLASSASLTSSSCVLTNLGSVSGGRVSTGYAAGPNIPFMTYPYPFPGMVTNHSHPATSGLSESIPASSTLTTANCLEETISASSCLTGSSCPSIGSPTDPTTNLPPPTLSRLMQCSSLYDMYRSLGANMHVTALARSGILASSGLGLNGNLLPYAPVSTLSSKGKTEPAESIQDQQITRKGDSVSRNKTNKGISSKNSDTAPHNKLRKASQNLINQHLHYESKEYILPRTTEMPVRAYYAYDEHGALDLTSSLKRSVDGNPTGHVTKKQCLKPDSITTRWPIADWQSSSASKSDTNCSHSESREFMTRKPMLSVSSRDVVQKHQDKYRGLGLQVQDKCRGSVISGQALQSWTKQRRVSDRGLGKVTHVKDNSNHVSRSSNVTTLRPSATTSPVQSMLNGNAMMNSVYASSMCDLASQSSALAAAHAAALAAMKASPAFAAGINPTVLELVPNTLFNQFSAQNPF